ncbi:MAG: RagB/SusD family nutrient uptake outer membrane protein [Saprospiraceae bacterium]|nr:RagB/SusD family nutrient uptake outer membrane protein [Saprospiraceae bacterium]
MKFNNILKISLIAFVLFSFNSCLKDLDTEPFYGLNTESVYKDPNNYIHVLAKLYAGLSLTGNKGPSDSPDISTSTIDEGSSSYLRVLWNLQELPTDEAICGWSDTGIPEMNFGTWSSETVWIKGMYYRIYYQITLCNEFISQTSDSKMSDRGFNDADKAKIVTYRNEARFLRALSYYHQLDLFRSGPFVTEDNAGETSLPRQIFKEELFNYVESELKAVENSLPEPKQNQYGRADKAAVWTLLAKLYLNAEVYVGQNRYTDAVTYSKKVIDSGVFSLDGNYEHLFLADNHLSNEIIFPVPYDGINTQSWGGTTYLVHASIGGNMIDSDYGVVSGWGGLRAKRSLFELMDSSNDSRYMFFSDGQQADVDTISSFYNGFGVEKWKNLDRNGVKGKDPNQTFVDIDFPLFRLADVYLMYAEAVLRGGSGGDAGTALNYVNAIRTRAYGNSSGNFASIDLNNLLDERARELYWEGYRRSDLVRFGKFTNNSYLWQWKGSTRTGTSIDDYRSVYPIPAADLVANPNLKQNLGY